MRRTVPNFCSNAGRPMRRIMNKRPTRNDWYCKSGSNGAPRSGFSVLSSTTRACMDLRNAACRSDYRLFGIFNSTHKNDPDNLSLESADLVVSVAERGSRTRSKDPLFACTRTGLAEHCFHSPHVFQLSSPARLLMRSSAPLIVVAKWALLIRPMLNRGNANRSEAAVTKPAFAAKATAKPAF